MLITDFNKLVKNWKLSNINPLKKELKVFLDDRVLSIKKLQSHGFNEANNAKAIKEQKFINSIVDLDSAYDSFMDHVEQKLDKSLKQYIDYINNGAILRQQNEFLKERLEIMDKRELMYLELLKRKS